MKAVTVTSQRAMMRSSGDAVSMLDTETVTMGHELGHNHCEEQKIEVKHFFKCWSMVMFAV